MPHRCKTCGEYIYKGKKFNARKETVQNEAYLGLPIFRFYIKCTRCLAEITFKVDARPAGLPSSPSTGLPFHSVPGDTLVPGSIMYRGPDVQCHGIRGTDRTVTWRIAGRDHNCVKNLGNSRGPYGLSEFLFTKCFSLRV